MMIPFPPTSAKEDVRENVGRRQIPQFLVALPAVSQSIALTKVSRQVYLLPATLEHTHSGEWFDNAQPPVLKVDSGDTVVGSRR